MARNYSESLVDDINYIIAVWWCMREIGDELKSLKSGEERTMTITSVKPGRAHQIKIARL